MPLLIFRAGQKSKSDGKEFTIRQRVAKAKAGTLYLPAESYNWLYPGFPG
jgi:hypothetical protein